MALVWTAYCVTCKEDIHTAPNGVWVECFGKGHLTTNERHEVIIGYKLEAE